MESNDCKLSIQEKQQMPETAESCQEKKRNRWKNKEQKRVKELQLFEIVSSYDKWEWQKDLGKQTMARPVRQPDKGNTGPTFDSLCPLKEHSRPVFKVQESHYCSFWLWDQLTGSGMMVRQQVITANNCTSAYSGTHTGNTCSLCPFWSLQQDHSAGNISRILAQGNKGSLDCLIWPPSLNTTYFSKPYLNFG